MTDLIGDDDDWTDCGLIYDFVYGDDAVPLFLLDLDDVYVDYYCCYLDFRLMTMPNQLYSI
jgi:hypothetical protein